MREWVRTCSDAPVYIVGSVMVRVWHGWQTGGLVIENECGRGCVPDPTRLFMSWVTA